MEPYGLTIGTYAAKYKLKAKALHQALHVENQDIQAPVTPEQNLAVDIIALMHTGEVSAVAACTMITSLDAVSTNNLQDADKSKAISMAKNYYELTHPDEINTPFAWRVITLFKQKYGEKFKQLAGFDFEDGVPSYKYDITYIMKLALRERELGPHTTTDTMMLDIMAEVEPVIWRDMELLHD